MSLRGLVSHAAGLIARYARWLHTGYPAGLVERLPQINQDGSTRVPGVYVAGDLTGIPLLKFAADAGARVARRLAADPDLDSARERAGNDVTDVVILGGGVAGIAAAIEIKKLGLSYRVLEASERAFNTIIDFPKAKPIYTYPTAMDPLGDLKVTADVKEKLVQELERQAAEAGIEVQTRARAERIRRSDGVLEVVLASGHVGPGHAAGGACAGRYRALRVIVAIGRSGNFRRLGVPGEDREKVFNRLHDPAAFADRRILVVGGGDSALEAASALARAGGQVTLSYRRPEFARPKVENVAAIESLRVDDAAAGRVRLMLASTVKEIGRETVTLADGPAGHQQTIDNDVVFTLIGREAPLDFFRRSGIPIQGEWRPKRYLGFGLFVLFCVFLYHWKTSVGELPLKDWFQERGWFPFNIHRLFASLGEWISTAANTKTSLLYTLRESMSDGGFYYTLTYCLCVVVFGIRRIKRRRTPYVKVQTLVLMAIQCLPLFVLPQILLPWAGHNGWFEDGLGGWVGRRFFPGGSYWRAYGFVLAWPLFIYNVFTDQPIWGWLVVSFIQTLVIIPLIIRRWGKGAYCGWICSCGALAETLGDAHRQKMPHGPIWNRLNMVGQVVLAFALALLILRICGWLWPGSFPATAFGYLFTKLPVVNYKWLVDVMLAGVIGVGCYFWFSGRVWCRFACPLAALMHIYAKFTTFRILADKKKCISCNVCTAVCHQGIDVMNFANKGRPMDDVECVRCSACVQSCPTGVLSFGRVDGAGRVISVDRLRARP